MAEYSEGDVVETDEGQGVVSGVFEKAVDWPVDGERQTVEGTEQNPVYIVALLAGGSKPYREDELTPSEFDGEMPSDEEVAKDLNEAEEASLYDDVDDVESLEDVQSVLAGRVRISNVAELSRTRGTSDMSFEELIDIPGVDDPGVGWSDYPDSWEESEQPNRLILLKAWTAMGATWRGCFREMSTNMTPKGARKLCSSMKDEVYGTEMWRGISE